MSDNFCTIFILQIKFGVVTTLKQRDIKVPCLIEKQCVERKYFQSIHIAFMSSRFMSKLEYMLSNYSLENCHFDKMQCEYFVYSFLFLKVYFFILFIWSGVYFTFYLTQQKSFTVFAKDFFAHCNSNNKW